TQADSIPAPRPIRQGFEFRNVEFADPGRQTAVVPSITFSLHRHEKVALIGENGAGKTTLVKLLTRLYDPTEGQILLDGIDLREYNLEDLYKEIGVIFQDFMRYEMKARDNIAVGQIDQINGMQALKMAAGKSMANEVIERLPHDYEQMLGRRFEN